MFHSSGFFSGMLCPYYDHGLCHRPYCLYRHSRRERPPPRKRPQLKTKYTNYPTGPATADTTSEGGSEASQGAAKEVTEESIVKEDKKKGNFAAAVFNFYGANEGASTNVGTGEGGGKSCDRNEMQIETVCEETETVVELPSYAPEVCVGTGVGVDIETQVLMAECSENEVNRGQTGPVPTETAEELIAVETKPHPPAHEECVDVTEEDIFGSSDEDMEACDNTEVELEGEGERGGGGEEEREGEEGREGEGERAGEGEGLREGEGGNETEREDIKAAFQSVLEAQATATTRAQALKRKANDGEDYPSTVQKKRRLALPKAEIYRQTSSSGRSKPKTTSSFAATLDKEALYMGKKRKALSPKAVTGNSKAAGVSRPRLPLLPNSKVPTKLRQKYLDSYIDEILKVTLDPKVAYEKAEKEEQQLFQKCSSRMTYCSCASQILQRLRKEAREFLDQQRKTSDDRVRAHRDSGCGSSETTPTGSEETPSSKERKSIGHNESEAASSLPQPTRKNIHKLKKKAIPPNSISPLSPTLPPTSSPSLHSPPILSPLSPQILRKCRSVKVSLTKCDIERSSSGDDTLAIGTAGKEVEISVRNEEDTLRSSQFYPVSRRSSIEIKKKKKEAGGERDRQSDVKGTRDRAPATTRDSNRRRERTSHKDSTDILVTCDTIRPSSTSHKGRTPSQTASVGSNDLDVEILKSTLFGDSDSDSDCIMLPSSCSSGEEEIMNVSFEDALRGVELSRGRGGRRRPVGVVSKTKTEGKGGSRKVVKGKERVREKTGGGWRELGEGGSGEVVSGESSKKVAKRREGDITRDTSNTASKGGQRKSSLDQQRPTRRASGSKGISSQLSHPPNGSRSKAKSDRRLFGNEADVGSSGLHGNNPDDFAFKPDSRSLVNLSAVAKSNQLTSTSVKGQRSHQAPPPSSPAPISKPTYTIFKKKEVNVTAPVFYEIMKSYLLTGQQLVENGYPQSTGTVGVASINWGRDPPPDIQPVGANAVRHRCCRCGKPFIIYHDGQYQSVEDCIYHYGRLIKVREYGEGVVSEYSCCNERRGSAGCQVAKLHVTVGARPTENTGYVHTHPPRPNSAQSEVVYALDCEMCYTTAGLELTRVSMVDISLKPVYETLVLPPHPIVDYNTRFSGLTAEDFVSVTTTLEDVQGQLLDLVTSDTILLGHSLESDLRALKIIHSFVVDTAIVFPHHKGPPLKRALRTLVKEHLQKFIQDNVDGGHDSMEDARSCMELMLWKVKGDMQKTTRRVS